MLDNNKNDFLKAGKITGIAREFAFKNIKEGLNIYDYVKSIEDKIFSLGGKLAFPVNISINDFAAHDTPTFKGIEEFKSGQVVKVDLGASYNGYLGDSAFTVEIGSNKYEKLILASQEALNNAIKLVKPGVKLCEIGKEIHKTIKNYGFNPIFNLGGHGLDKYNLHADLFIPNYDNSNNTKLYENQMIAIEPFATTGVGEVVNTNVSKIYSLNKKRPVRMDSSRKILKFIDENFKSLPFATYHLFEKFSSAQINIALKELLRNDILHSYSQLREKSNGIVSQAEHSILVKDKPIITTI
jgi:methionyl aminopeptidase